MSAAGSLAQTTAPGHAQNASSSLAHSAAAAAPIDRHALVTRHNVVVHTLDPNGAMAVGNGDFAFNFDVTGLQSFPEYYAKTMPIGILSDWGWHSFPNPDGYTLDKFPMTAIPKYGRQFIFPSASTSHPTPDAAYLRANPNRFGLGRIGLEMSHADGSPVLITDLKDITQTLDLWAGILTSSFRSMASPSASSPRPPHARRSRHAHQLAPHRRRPPQTPHRLPLRIRLLRPRLSGLDHPEAHTTILIRSGATAAEFDRTLDATHYSVYTRWSSRRISGQSRARINISYPAIPARSSSQPTSCQTIG